MSAEVPIRLGAQVVVHDKPADGSGASGRGLVGRVVQRRGGSYGVSLVDGRLIEVRPDALTLVGRAEPEPEPRAFENSADLVTRRTIYAVIVGGSHGTAAADDHPDVRGVYQAPTHTLFSLSKPPKHVAGPGPSWFSWEVERFCQLALKANPGCLEILWAPRAIWVIQAGQELLDLRGAFLSQGIAASYSEHARTQFKKFGESEGEHGRAWWGQATHQLRMLLDGIALLRHGDTSGAADDHGDQLAEVTAGRRGWDQVDAWRLELQQRLEEAAASTYLPAQPDGQRVSTWLHDLRRRDLDVDDGAGALRSGGATSR